MVRGFRLELIQCKPQSVEVTLSLVHKQILLHPARKKRGRKTDPQTRGFPPRQSRRHQFHPQKNAGGDTISFPENPHWKLFRILLEKSPNFLV